MLDQLTPLRTAGPLPGSLIGLRCSIVIIAAIPGESPGSPSMVSDPATRRWIVSIDVPQCLERSLRAPTKSVPNMNGVVAEDGCLRTEQADGKQTMAVYQTRVQSTLATLLVSTGPTPPPVPPACNRDELFASSAYTPPPPFKAKCCVDGLRPPPLSLCYGHPGAHPTTDIVTILPRAAFVVQ